MSDHTGDDAVPLRDYVEEVLRLNAEAVALARENQHSSFEQRNVDLDRRLGELNQLRSEVVADRLRFLPQDVYRVEHKALEERVDHLNEALDERVKLNETFRARATIIAPILVIVGGIIGAVIERVLGLR